MTQAEDAAMRCLSLLESAPSSASKIGQRLTQSAVPAPPLSMVYSKYIYIHVYVFVYIYIYTQYIYIYIDTTGGYPRTTELQENSAGNREPS